MADMHEYHDGQRIIKLISNKTYEYMRAKTVKLFAEVVVVNLRKRHIFSRLSSIPLLQKNTSLFVTMRHKFDKESYWAGDIK